MSHYCKNEVYKKFFNKLYESCSGNENIISDNIKQSVSKIENVFNTILNNFYSSNKNNEVDNNNIVPPPNNTTELLNEQLDHFNKIQEELKKIIKDNLKVRERRDDDDFAISRNNSEPVFIDKEELNDYTGNKRSPVININMDKENLNTIPSATLNSDPAKIIGTINESVNNINNIIQKIYELTRQPDHSSIICY
jgi:hypothetical protein